MPDPFRKKPSVSGRFKALHSGSPNPPASGPVSGRAKALHNGLTELQQANRATQQAQLAQFAQAGAALAAANEARYRAQLRTSHLVAPQDATSRYAAHLRQPPLDPRQQALVNHAHARRLYMQSRAVVRADPRTQAQRQADYSAGVLGRQTAEAAVINPATATTTRHDPALRSMAGAVVVAGTAQLAAAAVAEEVAAWSTWRGLGWLAARGMGVRFVANAAGQGVGNYIITQDAGVAFNSVNWVSPFLSAANVPLMSTSLLSASFRIEVAEGYKSVTDGSIAPSKVIQDAVVSYGFGQATRLSGFDKLHQSASATRFTAEARYQAQLRLSPRFAAGVGAAVAPVLEATNRTISTAARKVGATEVKKQLPK